MLLVVFFVEGGGWGRGGGTVTPLTVQIIEDYSFCNMLSQKALESSLVLVCSYTWLVWYVNKWYIKYIYIYGHFHNRWATFGVFFSINICHVQNRYISLYYFSSVTLKGQLTMSNDKSMFVYACALSNILNCCFEENW